MTTRDTPFPPGTPCWTEYRCADIDAAAAFYQTLFGWEVEEEDGYRNFVFNGRRVAGLAHDPTIDEPAVPPRPQPLGEGDAEGDAEGELALTTSAAATGSSAIRRHATWRVYICAKDLDAWRGKAQAEGGEVLGDVEIVDGVAATSLIKDPTGGKVGLWEPTGHTGYRRYNELGSVLWSEHQSAEYAKSTGFFGAVFGWKPYSMADSDEFRYAQALLNGQIVAGLFDAAKYLSEGYESYWAVYFSVAKTDDAVRHAEELGGKLIVPVEDTAFGRIADITDPFGAPLKLHQAPEPTLAFKAN